MDLFFYQPENDTKEYIFGDVMFFLQLFEDFVHPICDDQLTKVLHSF